MQKIIDKAVLLGLCLLAMSMSGIEWQNIVTMFAAIAVSAMSGYLEGRSRAGILCTLYSVMCLFIPEMLVFLPLIVYDCVGQTKWAFKLCWLIALPAGILLGAPHIALTTVLSCSIAFLLQYRTSEQIAARKKLLTLEDSTKERTEKLERKNRELSEKQDYEIKLATLAERNRIAREIHDNVGHLLTRSLLQIDAMKVTYADNVIESDAGVTDGKQGNKLEADLYKIKETLSDAMDSVRNSVHNLHDESLDLKSSIERMIDNFAFCPVKLRYDAGELPPVLNYCFTAIVREALSNIAKHSNATESTITVMEHPSFYQLVISDNGATNDKQTERGIGLINMEDRVTALDGIFRIEQSKGFKIFITIPTVWQQVAVDKAKN